MPTTEYFFSDFFDQYAACWRQEHTEHFTAKERLLIILPVIMINLFEIALAFHLGLWPIILTLAGTVLMFIIMIVHFSSDPVRDRYAHIHRQQKQQRFDMIRAGLRQLHIDYRDSDRMTELLEFCKKESAASDIYAPVRTHTRAILTVFLVPFVLSALKIIIEHQGTIEELLKSVGMILLIMVAVLSVAYCIYEIVVPHMNKEKKIYDSLITDLEELRLRR